MSGKEWTEWIVETLDDEGKTFRDRVFMALGAMESLADEAKLHGEPMAVFDAADVLKIFQKIADGGR